MNWYIIDLSLRNYLDVCLIDMIYFIINFRERSMNSSSHWWRPAFSSSVACGTTLACWRAGRVRPLHHPSNTSSPSYARAHPTPSSLKHAPWSVSFPCVNFFLITMLNNLMNVSINQCPKFLIQLNWYVFSLSENPQSCSGNKCSLCPTRYEIVHPSEEELLCGKEGDVKDFLRLRNLSPLPFTCPVTVPEIEIAVEK